MTRPLSPKAVAQTLLALSDHRSPTEIIGALKQLIQAGKLPQSRSFFRSILEQLFDQSGVVTVETAQPLTPAQEEQLRDVLTSQPRLTTSPIVFRVQPIVLGGFRLLHGNWLIDYSLAEQLRVLQQTFMEVSHG